MATWICMDCGMYDPYDGDGDGIGSCDCPRCEWCGGPPGMGCCPEDELPDWPDDVIVPVVTETADVRWL
jgi:hypothetical protein